MKYIIPRARKAAMIPCLWNGISQTAIQTKKIHGKAFDHMYHCYQSGNFWAFNAEKDWDSLGHYLAKKLFNQKNIYQGFISNSLKPARN